MTADRFLGRHGKPFAVLRDDLVEFLKGQSPAFDVHKIPVANDPLTPTGHLGAIQGYSLAVSELKQLGGEFVDDTPDEPTFVKSPEQIFVEEHPSDSPPPMPPPKRTKK